MENDSKKWAITIDKARFDKLRTEERFWQLLALARAVNALGFVQTRAAGDSDKTSPDGHRTTWNAFYFTCALLYEALQVVERLGKHFRQVPEFLPLRKILQDPVATELRNSNLNPLRNKLTFHFSEDEIGDQLSRLGLKTDITFVLGQGKTFKHVYYQLADVCTMGAFSGLQVDNAEAPPKLGELFTSVGDLSFRFMNAAETFIFAILKADGWQRMKPKPRPPAPLAQ